MNDTSAPVRRSSGVTPRAKLVRMLRSTLLRFPLAKLSRTRDGFGASLGENRYLFIRSSGDWTNEDLRDLLALFATWLVADPEYLRGGGSTLSGVFAEDLTQYAQSSTRRV